MGVKDRDIVLFRMKVLDLPKTNIAEIPGTPHPHSGRMALIVKNGLIFITVDEILYLRSDGNYCRIYSSSGRNIYVNKMKSALEKQLGPFGFVCINHQYLANFQHILRYEKGYGGALVLTDQTILPVSRERKRVFGVGGENE